MSLLEFLSVCGSVFLVFNTGTGSKLTETDMFDSSMLESIRHRDIPEIQSSSKTKSKKSGITATQLRIGEYRTCYTFRVLEELILAKYLGKCSLTDF